MKKTGLVFFPAFDWAISPTHPEREERLLYTRDQLFEEGVMDLPQISEYKTRLATLKDIARVHFCVPDIEAQITEAHLISAGSSLVIADAVMHKEVDNGFALVRPPGHHAMTVAHGNRGFCNINNEAIMVEYLRKKYGLRKIAIVDTDVHHGDGTQEIFWHDPDILFISFHQDGRTLYPGSGYIDELGGPLAHGTTLNIPLAPNTTDEGIHYVLEHLVLPVLDEFEPELVINSAGQDNHYSDPLANMSFSAQGYAVLNEKLAPDIAVLEGGYSVETALPYVNMGIIMAMAGIDYSNLREPDYKPGNFQESARNMDYIKKLIDTQLTNFRSRAQVVEQNRHKYQADYSYHKSIYYDTDGIQEQQAVRLHICNECAGYRTIESTAQHSRSGLNRVFCISVPAYGCPDCQQEARRIYEAASGKKKSFDYVYYQDKLADIYLHMDTARNAERVF